MSKVISERDFPNGFICETINQIVLLLSILMIVLTALYQSNRPNPLFFFFFNPKVDGIFNLNKVILDILKTCFK